MLRVLTPKEANELIRRSFTELKGESERLRLSECVGRVTAKAITANEYVPGFDRSTVDGYALAAKDSFGCSDAIPAILKLKGVVKMGEATDIILADGECAYVPTGGELPQGSDAVVMIEYSESYGGGEIGILKPIAPGGNVIYKGDDVFPGKTVVEKGRRLRPEDIGALAALGICDVEVAKKPTVAVISTGDELVPIEKTPNIGQVRDVNSAMLCAAIENVGAKAVPYGIVKDGYVRLRDAINTAIADCDMLLISGGSSVGQMDSTCAVIDELGELLFHGIAMKPGKPTILGRIGNKPVFGLPGHPVAAHFVTELFVKPLIMQMMGATLKRSGVRALLTENVSANHGREQLMGAKLYEENGVTYAIPVHGKSGLISTLSGCDGYFSVPRDTEGYAKGSEIEVYINGF